MKSFVVAAVFLGAASVLSAEPMTYIFIWQGSGGYTMSGAVAFNEAAEQGRFYSQFDVDCFEIAGFRDGIPIGRWALQQLTEDTTWELAFDPLAEAFVTYGPGWWMPQGWNMDGYGENCGPGGFGFNIGNAAQDLCLDGHLLFESQVDPGQPFPATQVETYAFANDACLREELIG